MLQIARSTLSKGALGSLPINITDVKFRGNYIKRVPATWDSIYGGEKNHGGVCNESEYSYNDFHFLFLVFGGFAEMLSRGPMERQTEGHTENGQT